MTQDRSKVLRETEENPFKDDEDEESPSPAHSRHTSIQGQSSRTPVSPISFSDSFSSSSRKVRKEEKKKAKKKSKGFNLEAEKETMKDCIAESSVASTNLLNALRLVNREREQISENQAAVHHFESCKLLRRKILRYVLVVSFLVHGC